MISVQDPAMLEQLSKNVTRQGMTNVTLNYLRVCDVSNTFLSIMINLICCDVNHIHFDLYSRTDLMLLLDPGEGGGGVYTLYSDDKDDWTLCFLGLVTGDLVFFRGCSSEIY